MLGELVPCGGGDPIPLHWRKLVVGRSSDCDVVLRAPSVSGKHCSLRFVDGCWFVRDLGSRNGTTVNGKSCTKARLMPDDVVSFSTQRFVIVYQTEYEPPEDPVAARTAAATEHADDRVSGVLTGDSAPQRIGGLLGRLVPCAGGPPIPLFDPIVIIGRTNDCDIQLGLPTVSSWHCRLELKAGHWFVQDLNSRNGISIDSIRCDFGWLPPESVISIAGLRLQIFYTPADDEWPADEFRFGQGLLEKSGMQKMLISSESSKWLRADDDPPRKRWDIEVDE